MAKLDRSILLSDLKTRTEFCIREVKRLLKQKEINLNARPNPETWSALQCVAHLNQFGEYYIPELNLAIEKSKLPATSHFSPGFIGNIYANAMRVKPRMTKMQAPADKSPSIGDLDKSVLNDFIDQQKQYLEILKLAEGIDLNKTKVKVTISKWVKLKLGDALRVTIYHNERHIIQALKALKNS